MPAAVRGTCPNARLRGRSVLGSPPGTPGPEPGPGTDREAPREGPQRQIKGKARTSAAGQSKEEMVHKDQDPDVKPRGAPRDVSLSGCQFLGRRPSPGSRVALPTRPQRWSKTAVFGSQLEARPQRWSRRRRDPQRNPPSLWEVTPPCPSKCRDLSQKFGDVDKDQTASKRSGPLPSAHDIPTSTHLERTKTYCSRSSNEFA